VIDKITNIKYKNYFHAISIKLAGSSQQNQISNLCVYVCILEYLVFILHWIVIVLKIILYVIKKKLTLLA